MLKTVSLVESTTRLNVNVNICNAPLFSAFKKSEKFRGA